MLRFSILLIFKILALSLSAQPLGIGAERAPCFQGCENTDKPDECTRHKLAAWVSSQIQYPGQAERQAIEGEVLVSVVIAADGRLDQARVIKDIGGGCGSEALRLVGIMPPWVPAQSQGEAVSTDFVIEIPFKLSFIKPEANAAKSSGPLFLEPTFEDVPALGRVYTHVERMPFFTGCEHLSDEREALYECSNENIIQYIQGNLRYPESAVEREVEGVVPVDFVIDEQGRVVEAQVLRDIDPDCTAEALRVIREMPNWHPGYHNDQAVKVRMRVPLHFSIVSSNPSNLYEITWGDLRGNTLSANQLRLLADERIVVRGLGGDPLVLTSLTLLYEHRGKSKTERSSGDLSADMFKLLEKARPGSRVRFTAGIYEQGRFVDVVREFEIVN